MSGLGKNFRERIAAQLERDKAEGRDPHGEDWRFLLRFRQTARASATEARKSVGEAFATMLRRDHPGTDWTVVPPNDADAGPKKRKKKEPKK